MNEVEIDPPRIRWIAFDAVDTLIRPNPSVAAIYHQIGARHGSRLALDEVRSRFRQAFAHTEAEGVLTCLCPETDQAGHTCEARERLRWRLIVESVLADVRSRETCFEELFVHFGQPSSWSCFADVEPALAALSQAGYRLAVSSNFDARLNGVMDGLPDLSRIELRIISSLVRHRKPSPRFFESLLARAGCEPTEVLFIGDKADTDVAAANAAGIPALRIDRAATSGDNRVLRTLAEIADRLGKGAPSQFPGHQSANRNG
ncbi:MAG TPA: HAD-IA family hydrolase [Planctomycetaceae bacterium]|jgi:putative hydrolase of the HAD superfamily|nr:HAD-IA family hydrolase [Planctomycetaceae bacterium]